MLAIFEAPALRTPKTATLLAVAAPNTEAGRMRGGTLASGVVTYYMCIYIYIYIHTYIYIHKHIHMHMHIHVDIDIDADIDIDMRMNMHHIYT